MNYEFAVEGSADDLLSKLDEVVSDEAARKFNAEHLDSIGNAASCLVEGLSHDPDDFTLSVSGRTSSEDQPGDAITMSITQRIPETGDTNA